MPKSLLNQSLNNTESFKTVFSNLTLIDLRIIAFLHWMWNNYDAIWRLAKSILGIWQVDVAKLASVRTIVLCSSSSICIYGGRRYSRIPLKSKNRVHKRVHKRTNKVHKRIRKSNSEMRFIIAKEPYPACWGIGRFSRAIYRLGY